MLPKTGGGDEASTAYTEKLTPQPQDATAFGFLTRNDCPIRSSTKSSSAPLSISSDTGSTSTVAPSRVTATSSSARVRSTSKAYWKPEQPPPLTEILSATPASPLRMALRRRAALALIETPSRAGETASFMFIAFDRLRRRAGVAKTLLTTRYGRPVK